MAHYLDVIMFYAVGIFAGELVGESRRNGI